MKLRDFTSPFGTLKRKKKKSFLFDKHTDKLNSLDNCTGNWNYIPTKESIQYTMHRLIGAALLLDKVSV